MHMHAVAYTCMHTHAHAHAQRCSRHACDWNAHEVIHLLVSYMHVCICMCVGMHVHVHVHVFFTPGRQGDLRVRGPPLPL